MKYVKISGKDFEMSTTQVTQRYWQKIMGGNPSFLKESQYLPATNVSWNDCKDFIERLNTAQKKYIYRLPTEAEWEFCTKSCDDQPILDIAWVYENSGNKTHPVKQKLPNSFGLYDMLGNVWEWCEDLYSNYDSCRVLRGGSWFNSAQNAQNARSAFRSIVAPSLRSSSVGFRLVRTLALPSSALTLEFTAKLKEAINKEKILKLLAQAIECLSAIKIELGDKE